MRKTLLLITLLLIVFPAIAQTSVGSAGAHVQGRNIIGALPKPSYSVTSEGVVVVQVKVDQYGNVTEAIPGAEGTTTTDKELWKAARNAAMKSQFNMAADAPALQTGTITYCFGLDSRNVIAPASENIDIKFTHIKTLVNSTGHGTYYINAHFVKTHDLKKLIFLVEEDDYIIPVQLLKKDLGAEKRFLALNLKEGDRVVIKGHLSRLEVDYEYFNGLSDAVILEANDTIMVQESIPSNDSEVVPFRHVEVKPSFNGGDANEFSKWVNSHLNYPPKAKKNGIQGRVTLQFTIKADGSMSDVKILHGIDKDLDKEAVRVVSMSPKWEPGSIKGKPVNVTYTFPVIFQLR